MTFYESIAPYYDYIFPLRQAQVSFVRSFILDSYKTQLDIGCATGNLGIEICKEHFQVQGIDLDSHMIEMANEKAGNKNATFSIVDMKKLDIEFEDESFDMVTCFGNTLVHLENKTEINAFIECVQKKLRKGGIFLLQILNYERILREQIQELPFIDNEHISFRRNYEFEPEKLLFKTKLRVKNEERVISNEISLFPLLFDDLDGIVKAYFSDVQYYGNFEKEEFSKESFPLIASALKE